MPLDRMTENMRPARCKHCTSVVEGEKVFVPDVRIFRCRGCGHQVLGAPGPKVCPACCLYVGWEESGILSKSQAVKSNLVCVNCSDKFERCEKLVRDGGVFWFCKCGSFGALPKKSLVAKAVRGKGDFDRVEFDECPVCSPMNEDEPS